MAAKRIKNPLSKPYASRTRPEAIGPITHPAAHTMFSAAASAGRHPSLTCSIVNAA